MYQSETKFKVEVNSIMTEHDWQKVEDCDTEAEARSFVKNNIPSYVKSRIRKVTIETISEFNSEPSYRA